MHNGQWKIKEYHTAITQVAPQKIVLDLEGSGLYTLFAMKAKARKCYTLVSEEDRHSVQRLLENNKWFTNQVVLIHNLNQVSGQVDVIIHDWDEGQILALTNLIQLVKARDQWLVRKGGCIVPHEIRLHLAAITDPTFKDYVKELWDFSAHGLDVYGHVSDVHSRNNVLWGPLQQPPVSPQIPLWAIKPMTTSLDHLLNFRTHFILQLSQAATVHGLALFLEVRFISTMAKERGWKSCHQKDPYTFFLSKPIENFQAGEFIGGEFSYSVQNKEITTEISAAIKIRKETSKFHFSEVRKDTMI